MSRKILKVLTVVLLLALLTMPNFIYVGAGLVSYAESATATSHQNVEFDAKLKEGDILSLSVNVKREGYFNGEITLENSNFTFDTTQTNQYISKIEANKVYLNQLNAGTNAQLDLKIQPIQSDIFDIGLLNIVSKLNITGIYRDRTEKNINITGTREVELKYTEDNTNESIVSTAKVITNKVLKVSGEDKRVVQLEMNLGLKENNYPIKEIEVNIDIPSINGKYPKVVRKYDFATMKRSEGEYKYDGEQSRLTVKFYNEPDENNKVRWVKQGNEKVVFTFIYDEDAKDATLNDVQYPSFKNLINGDGNIGLPAVKVTLYDGKELNKIEKMTKDVMSEVKEEIVTVNTTNLEDAIYKGKLYAGIDRQYESKTSIAVNLANAENGIDVKETSENTVFNKTVISKDAFDKIFGENGQITILNEKSEVLATIDNKTEADQNKNIVIDYTGKEPSTLEIKATTPVKEGNIELNNVKTIKAENSSFNDVSELNTSVTYEYISGEKKETNSVIKLEEPKTDAELTINKDTLSTVVENNVEIKAILKGNNEQYNLFKNPVITMELPEDVQSATFVDEPQVVYDKELKVKNHEINGRIVTITLEGEQKEYKNTSIEGTVIVVNLNINLNNKATSKDTKINMTIVNNEQEVQDSKDIKVVAPKDITAINSIKELNIETIGQEELKTVQLQRGTNSKQLESSIEIINNNENAIENVKIMGIFPTRNKENNIDINITEGIQIEGANVYYTENEDATEDVNNAGNAWKQEITDGTKVKKYLVVVQSIDKQSSINASYIFEVPELLEYNQLAAEGYSVKYTNSFTKIESELKATTIKLETGVGPVLETKIVPTIAGTDVNSNTTVKNGEVIRYRVEVSNTGSEKLTDVLVIANVPEGTTLVTPEDNYEYTGASYYKELPSRTYEAKIDSIEPGQVRKGEYEVRVNSDTTAGTILVNEAQLKYGDVTKKSNQVSLITESGDIRVSVKRVTDRKIELYENGNVEYYVIIENISEKKSDNVNIKTNLPSNFSVDRVTLITGMDENKVNDEEIYRMNDEKNIVNTEAIESELEVLNTDSIQSEELDYSDNINIGSIDAKAIKVLCYGLSINKANQTDNRKFSVLAKENNAEYRSNIIEENINKIEVSINMTSNNQSQYVKSGDILEYTIKIDNNTENRIEGIVIKDQISKSLTVKRVSFDDEEIPQLAGINEIEIYCNIAAKSDATIKIQTVVNYAMSRTSAEAISNVAYAEIGGERIAETSELTHIIEGNEVDEPENPSDPAKPGSGENPSDGDISDGKQIITGVAWLDENGNGKKDDTEKTLNNVKVHLLNTETNNLVKDLKGNILEAITNEKGIYILDKVRNGKYIVIFEYNNTLYTLTKYKAEKVEENKNSNAIANELIIDNKKQVIASTDIIEINNNNISNINIGLIELKDFAFRLDKYVSRILVQNSAGTTVKEYTNATVAKAELDAKKVNGTNVIIEYEIKVTNIGEVEGYVRKIVDYMPSDLKFSSELNKDWYQSGTDLFNASLANEKIPAGQSKTVKLVLTKAMTENNTGLINNTAEIGESYNDLGIKDSKSTSGNKAKGESDYGSADAILSLKTGEETYIAIAAVTIAILGLIVFVVMIKKQNKGDIK